MERRLLTRRSLDDSKRLQEILRIDRITVLPNAELMNATDSFVYLTQKAIHYNCGNNNKKHTIQLSDVTGCHHMRGNAESDVNGYFRVFSYRLHKKTGRRERNMITFLFDKGSKEENWKTGQLWHKAVNLLLRGINQITRDKILNRELPEKKVLVLINPFSGKKKGLTTYWNIVAPMLVEASYKFKSLVTTCQGHATQMMMDEDLSQWTSILLVGGDGLMFEVVNALMRRKDWREAIKTPLGLIPAGSGNGLVATLLFEKHESNVAHKEVNAMFRFLKGEARPLDLTYIKVGQLEYYSFLSVSWGCLADIDINSEVLRFLGDTRFYLWSFGKILVNDVYSAKIKYVEWKSKEPFYAIELPDLTKGNNGSNGDSKESNNGTIRNKQSAKIEVPKTVEIFCESEMLPEECSSADTGASASTSCDNQTESVAADDSSNKNRDAAEGNSEEEKEESDDDIYFCKNKTEANSNADLKNNRTRSTLHSQIELSSVWVEEEQRKAQFPPIPQKSLKSIQQSNPSSPHEYKPTPSVLSLPGKYENNFREDFDQLMKKSTSVSSSSNGMTDILGKDRSRRISSPPTSKTDDMPKSWSFDDEGEIVFKDDDKAKSTPNNSEKPRGSARIPKRASESRLMSSKIHRDNFKTNDFRDDQNIDRMKEMTVSPKERITYTMDSIRYPPTPICDVVPTYPPEKWQTIESNTFSFVLACNVSHIGFNMYYSPKSRPDDGFLQLGYCLHPVPRQKLLRIVTSVPTGEHLNVPDMVVKQVKAFEIEFEQATENMNLVIDGEKVPNATKMSCTILPSLARIVY